uniref:Uncharacterized protein n=1 Tax=Anguilla anguilla TaxID=7936 RepID=A0A0E9WV02_ANGAN
MTASIVLGLASTSFVHCLGVFFCSFLKDLSRLLRLFGSHLWATIFKQCHTFSMVLRSGL